MSATTTTSAAPPAPAATVAASANANGNTTKRVAVITGAGQGIGAGIAVRLAKDGLDLVLSDLPSNRENLDKVAEECRANGAKVVVKDCDVADEAQVKALVEATKELGGIDVMVANAGIAPIYRFVDTPISALDQVYNVNVRGVYLCYQAAARAMIEQGRGGKLIGAASTAGLRGAPNFSAYCASKHAVAGINAAVAEELAPHGITANCYAPTICETDMLTRIDKDLSAIAGAEAGAFIAMRKAAHPMGRNVKVSDVTDTVSWLASEGCKFVTGVLVPITVRSLVVSMFMPELSSTWGTLLNPVHTPLTSLRRHPPANCYAPTICETDMLTRIDKDLSAIAGAEAGAFIAMRKAAHPMGRNVKVSDVTDTVSWLASEGCKFVTGVLVPITAVLVSVCSGVAGRGQK
ncbi:hypothetical protein A1Q2_07562 [Trichosporon asahii var. asahii CBS 8904]|uniref:Uncharacterized protein n=1 Tax=Trichosporon asahii var. asahii (strain CBS 8904) TaxID=1220162 RepID=K1VGJ0_TRIAC|nr:hypothetical protein A1Q2_07562 [Trichosporon asahii var. asahii CBS 8904]